MIQVCVFLLLPWFAVSVRVLVCNCIEVQCWCLHWTLFRVSTVLLRAWLHVFSLRWQLLISTHTQGTDEKTWPTHTTTPLTSPQQLSCLALTLVCYSATRAMLWDEHSKLFRVCMLVEWVKWWWIYTHPREGCAWFLLCSPPRLWISKRKIR